MQFLLRNCDLKLNFVREKEVKDLLSKVICLILSSHPIFDYFYKIEFINCYGFRYEITIKCSRNLSISTLEKVIDIRNEIIIGKQKRQYRKSSPVKTPIFFFIVRWGQFRFVSTTEEHRDFFLYRRNIQSFVVIESVLLGYSHHNLQYLLIK